MRKDYLEEQFYAAYHNPNSGSSAMQMEKWLHENLPDMSNTTEYTDFEHFCNQLAERQQEHEKYGGRGYVEMPGMWYGMVAECARRLIAMAVQASYHYHEEE